VPLLRAAIRSAGEQHFHRPVVCRDALACGGENYIETVWGRGYVLRDLDEMEEPLVA
jgi:DNA-binding response OmpR family regulator